MNSATKTEIDAAKAASKKVVQKPAEATRDLIRNKIADKITSVGKKKSKEKEDETKTYIPPKKKNQINDELRLFQIQYKNEILKNYKGATCNI